MRITDGDGDWIERRGDHWAFGTEDEERGICPASHLDYSDGAVKVQGGWAVMAAPEEWNRLIAPPAETEPEGDKKPRGEKVQWHLAVCPSTTHRMLQAFSHHPDWVDSLTLYQEMPGEEYASDLAAGLLSFCLPPGEEESPEHSIKALDAAGRVFEYGAQKYAPGNFRKAFYDMPSMRREYTSAIQRHMWALSLGQHTDPESGHPHTAHAICGALMLLEGEMSQ